MFQCFTWQRKTVTRSDVRAGQEVAGSKKDTLDDYHDYQEVDDDDDYHDSCHYDDYHDLDNPMVMKRQEVAGSKKDT